MTNEKGILEFPSSLIFRMGQEWLLEHLDGVKFYGYTLVQICDAINFAKKHGWEPIKDYYDQNTNQ